MNEILALFGGTKLLNKTTADLTYPVVPQSAYEKVNELMRKGEISISPSVKIFEQKFKEYIGCKYGVAMTSGTSSIQAGLFAIGVGAGDEVIVPSYTFWASVGPVVANNAVPVFADVDVHSHTLTKETIEKCITNKTKAIIVVHVWGTPCDMDPIMELARKYNLKVLEDCSHAHGAIYHGKKVGSIGDVGCFSMQGSKVLPAGEGGMLVTNNLEYFERACTLGRVDALPEDSEYRRYSLTGFGYKFRPHPLGIAIADANLDILDDVNKKRKENGEYFESLLADLDCIEFQKIPENSTRVYAYHFVRYIPEKLKGLSLFTFLKAVAAEGVIVGSCGYGKLHSAPFFTEKGPFGHGCPLECPHYNKEAKPQTSLPNTDILSVNTFMIAPRFETATREDIELYAKAYHKVAGSVDELLEYEEKNNLAETKITNQGKSINYFK